MRPAASLTVPPPPGTAEGDTAACSRCLNPCIARLNRLLAETDMRVPDPRHGRREVMTLNTQMVSRHFPVERQTLPD